MTCSRRVAVLPDRLQRLKAPVYQARLPRVEPAAYLLCTVLSFMRMPRGAPLDGVQSPTGILGPRVRPAPDGSKAGDHHPTESHRIPRRFSLAPTLLRHEREKTS
jgi:hypothetical protein